MNESIKEKELFYKMRDLKEKLNNHENYDKYELLNELNNIGKEIYEIPLFKEYGELFKMYQEIFDEPLFAGLETKGE